MRPINKYIVIKKIDEELRSESGLIMTQHDAANFRYQKAKIIKVGTNVDTLLDGQEIYYDKNAGHTMMINDESYTIIRETDVVVVLD